MHRDIGCVSLENAGMEVNDCSGIERIFFCGSQASLCVDVKKCPQEERNLYDASSHLVIPSLLC